MKILVIILSIILMVKFSYDVVRYNLERNDENGK